MKDSKGRVIEFSMESSSKWQEYERRKNEFIAKNGWVSESEYQAMINRICAELGL